ncbi:MAG TPA: FG-GAP-like repeat-containing protein [Sedimentisphaerales bacterium]|nr:FG-GAP-like repeat-containing protein [Sedimentisphaerales bacterium]
MDLDSDGHRDIVTGSWPGEIFLFKGGPDGSFAAPEMIKDKEGKFINIGGGIRESSMFSDVQMLIAGNARFEQTPEGTFVNYHGERFESTPERPIGITGTASAAHAADWDGDGDLDLIIGDIKGSVYLVPNEGTPQSYSFGKERNLRAGGQSINVRRSAGPFAADWDADGDLDLLVGADDGSVSLFRNTGNTKSPELTVAVQLIPPGEKASSRDAPKEVRRGTRSKICVADWNDDGRLDLLVGDYTMQKPNLPEPTPEQKAEHERIRKELEPLQKQFGELISKVHGPARVKTKEEITQVQEQMGQVSKRMSELRSKLPREYECHGWVWLFLRKEG